MSPSSILHMVYPFSICIFSFSVPFQSLVAFELPKYFLILVEKRHIQDISARNLIEILFGSTKLKLSMRLIDIQYFITEPIICLIFFNIYLRGR